MNGKPSLILDLSWLVVSAERIEVDEHPQWKENPYEEPTGHGLTHAEQNGEDDFGKRDCNNDRCEVVCHSLDADRQPTLHHLLVSVSKL